MKTNIIYSGDCLQVLKTFPNNSIDSIVTDPPYGLRFMGKDWDRFEQERNSYYDFTLKWARECLRVLKPGGFLLAFSGTRTYHRLACAIEDAGFEIRDMIEWVYGSGFPKSLDINKQLDKNGKNKEKDFEGWGTALKPAHEPICLARKPLSEKSIVDNVLKWGVGGLNIGACRIPCNQKDKSAFPEGKYNIDTPVGKIRSELRTADSNPQSRFPANFILDEEAAEELDKQRGAKVSKFFYCAKVSSNERTCNGKIQNNHPTVKPIALIRYLIRLITSKGGVVLDPFIGSGTTGIAALLEGMSYIGIEKEPEYIKIAEKRIQHFKNNIVKDKK